VSEAHLSFLSDAKSPVFFSSLSRMFFKLPEAARLARSCPISIVKTPSGRLLKVGGNGEW
jgi:hypothetical protein